MTLSKRQQMHSGAAALILMLGLFLTGCGGGGENRGAVANTYTFAGRVTDESGNAVAGAAVQVNGGTAVATDAAGGFSAVLAVPGSSGAAVQLSMSKPGYVPGYKTYRMASGDVATGRTFSAGDIPLQREAATAAQATQVRVTHADGSSETVTPTVSTAGGLTAAQATVSVAAGDRAVTFYTPAATGAPASVTFTVGDTAGAGPNAASVLGAAGTYTGSIAYGDPTDAADLALFPGDFTTTSDTGGAAAGRGALVTAGFARISLTDAAGQPVTQFAPGTAAAVTMRVPASAANPETGGTVAAGDTIPVFIFNESTGEWVVELNSDGSVKRATVQSDAQGLFVTFTTTHLTWFNLDWKADTCEQWKPRVSLVDAAGAPVKGATYYALIAGWKSVLTDYRSTGVMYFLFAPSGVDWKVWAEFNGAASEVVTVHNCAHSVTGQSDITLTLSQACAPACSADTQCDDGNDATLDECSAAGTCAASCIHSSTACRSDADCDDRNTDTADTCLNPGTASATCMNTSYEITCYEDADCDDANPDSKDVCDFNYNFTESFCANNAILHACESNTDCDDGDAYTQDFCVSLNDSFQYCLHRTLCETAADCNDGLDFTVDYCSNNPWGPDYCVNSSMPDSCPSDSTCQTSIPEWVGFCVSPAAGVTNCNYAYGCSSDIECNDDWTLTMDACRTSMNGTRYCTNRQCDTDADCEDGDALTVNFCAEYSSGSSYCHAYSPCATNADCNDNQENTIDTCLAFYPDPYNYCENIIPVCSMDTDCDDRNSGTLNVCVNPGTRDAHCNFPLTGARAQSTMRKPAAKPSPSITPAYPPYDPRIPMLSRDGIPFDPRR